MFMHYMFMYSMYLYLCCNVTVFIFVHATGCSHWY